MPEEEIGLLNLKEFDALLKRKRADQNRERLNFGYVCSVILNSAPFGDPDRKAASPTDFVPDFSKEHAKNKPQAFDLSKLSPQQQKIYLMNTFSKRRM